MHDIRFSARVDHEDAPRFTRGDLQISLMDALEEGSVLEFEAILIGSAFSGFEISAPRTRNACRCV